VNRFILSGRAKQHLFDIWDHYANDSIPLADRMREELYQAFTKLARMPGIGHYREDLLDKRYKFWAVRKYLIVYLWEEKPICIVSIVHGERDLKAFFEEPPER
jgi:plasmid stabilization system protein ParE